MEKINQTFQEINEFPRRKFNEVSAQNMEKLLHNDEVVGYKLDY